MPPAKVEFPRRQVLPEALLWLLLLPLCATSVGRRCFAVELLGALSAYLFVFWVQRRAQLRVLRALPGPHQAGNKDPDSLAGSWLHTILGTAAHFRAHFEDLPDYQLRLVQRYGPVCADIPPLWSKAGLVYVAAPAVVQHVLCTNTANFIKPEPFRLIFREIFGAGIFNANHGKHAADGGYAWYVQRKVAARVFTSTNFRTTFERTFIEHGTEVVAQLREVAGVGAGGSGLDIQALMFRFTLESFGEIGFGTKLGCLRRDVPFSMAFDRATALAFGRLARPGWQLVQLLSASERELARHVAVLDAFAMKAIAKRRAELAREAAAAPAAGSLSKEAGDLLSLFLRADFTGYGGSCGKKGMPSDSFLRDVVLNFAVAGRDTTACTLTFAVHALSLPAHAHVEAKLAAEVLAVLGRDGLPTYEKVNAHRSMPFLHGFVQEVLRLWPPVPFDPKFCVESDVLPGCDGSGEHRIPGGCSVMYLPFAMGRDAALWGKDADELRPERWMEAEGGRPIVSAHRSPVFQAGPRVCLGINMALFEVKVLVAMLVQQFTFSPVPGRGPVRKQVNITLSVKDGLHVRVANRPHDN